MAEKATVAADRRRGPQREAETPQHMSLRDSYLAARHEESHLAALLLGFPLLLP